MKLKLIPVLTVLLFAFQVQGAQKTDASLVFKKVKNPKENRSCSLLSNSRIAVDKNDKYLKTK